MALKPNSAEAHYNLGCFTSFIGRTWVGLAQYRRYRDLGGRDERVERIIGFGGPLAGPAEWPVRVKSCVDAPGRVC